MRDRLPHGLGGRGHWRECYGGSLGRVNGEPPPYQSELFFAARPFDFVRGEQNTKVLDRSRGRIPQARAPDCGFNPCSAETGSVRRREAGSCYDERDSRCGALGRGNYEGD
jgi:hypothetical protein